MNDTDAFLEHFGVKGMHWGIRNDRPSGVSRSTLREASKDAKEFARAKQFTGEGAGNRRKHINATVASKKQKSASYAKAFDAALAAQDISKHVTKAKRERKRKDVALKTKQRAGFVARHLTGEMGTQAAFTAVALGGAAFVASPKGQSIMKNTFSKGKVLVENQRLKRSVTNLINNSMR